MNYEELNKGVRILLTTKHLAVTFGEGNFKIKDNWGEDFHAIGLTNNEERFLIYISTYGGKDFFVSLENLKPVDDLPYEPVGAFNNLDLKGLEKVFVQHLRL